MKTIKSPQSIPTPEPVPPKPETAGPNVATIPLVYASQMALTAALRSANAGDACTRENEMVSKIPQIISETAFFICPLPMLRCGGFTLIPLGYLPQVFPPNTCGISPRSYSGLYLMPYSDFAGGRGWPTPWSPGYTFVQRSHRSPHPAIRQRLQVRSAYPWRVHFDHCAGNGPVGCPPGDRRLHHDDPAAGRLEAQDPQFLLIEGHHFLLSDHDQHPIDVQQNHPPGLHLAPGHVRTAVCEIPALKADYSPPTGTGRPCRSSVLPPTSAAITAPSPARRAAVTTAGSTMGITAPFARARSSASNSTVPSPGAPPPTLSAESTRMTGPSVTRKACATASSGGTCATPNWSRLFHRTRARSPATPRARSGAAFEVTTTLQPAHGTSAYGNPAATTIFTTAGSRSSSWARRITSAIAPAAVPCACGGISKGGCTMARDGFTSWCMNRISRLPTSSPRSYGSMWGYVSYPATTSTAPTNSGLVLA